jgi:glucose/arabinose dehydrogenase
MKRRYVLAATAGVIAGCTGRNPATQDEAGTATTVTGKDTTTETATEAPETEEEGDNPARIAPAGPSVQLEPVAEELEQPVDMFTLPSHDGRYYVAEQMGRVRAFDQESGTEDVVLDISDELVDQSSWEQGLLGVALHPDFEANRKLYLRYSGEPLPDAPEEYSHTFVVAEYRMNADGWSIDPESQRLVMTIPEPGPVHNGGGLAFGPEDGYLYLGIGDGGGGQFDSGPGHVTDWYAPLEGGNGQDITENLLGGILRIDVDATTDGKGYRIPSDNPLVGKEGLDEYYAWGLRNPFTLSFGDGKLFVGDVGQDSHEEVNIVEKGGNYGWNVREGPDCLNSSSCPDEDPDGNSLRDPILSYSHRETSERTTSVIGGSVYRGSVEPLVGTYVFGDLLRGGYGHLLSATSEGGTWTMKELTVANRENGTLNKGEAVTGFGTDNEREMYVLITNFGGESGGMYRIIPST